MGLSARVDIETVDLFLFCSILCAHSLRNDNNEENRRGSAAQ